MRTVLLRRVQSVSLVSLVSLASLSPLALVACSSAPRAGESLGASGQAVVTPDTPVLGPSSTADLAPLAVYGSFEQAGPAGSPTEYGQYTAMTDLDVDPTPLTGLPVNASSWLARASAYATAPNFASDLSSATSYAITQTQPLPSDIESVWSSKLSSIFGVPNVLSVGQDFYGWTPVAGRYVTSAWGTSRHCTQETCFLLPYQYSYPDPPDLQEQRERGARLYCAARTARAAQGSSTIAMGQQAAVTFNVLNQQVQLLVVEPMVSIDGPQRYVGSSNDGSQAFVVPMKFGTRVSPILGLGGTPSLPEIRYPVALVSGDSEVATNADLVNGVYQKQYLTADHMDTFVVGQTSLNLKNTFPLLSIGPVTVDMTLGMKIASGQSQIAPGRVLDYGGIDGAVVPRTTLQATSAFIDGPWAPNDVGVNNNVIAPFWAEPGNVNLSAVSFPAAFYTKALQNDDHYLQGGETSVVLDASLTGSIGGGFGPVNVGFSVSGGITGEVNQLHMVRDAAFAQEPHGTSGMVPATGIVVRPRTKASVTLGPLVGDLNMSVNLGFFTATWTETLFSTGTETLASYDSDTATTNPWPASSNLRIGTGSGLGADIRDLPTVNSQLPNGAPFQALGESVSSCLADTTANAPSAPACGSTTPVTAPTPSANLCGYPQMNEYSCSSLTPLSQMPVPSSYEQCGDDITAYLCGIPKHSQVGAGNPVSAVLSTTALTAIGNEMKACGILAHDAGLTNAQVESYLSYLLAFQPCDANGNWLNVASASSTATAAPPVTTAKSCN